MSRNIRLKGGNYQASAGEFLLEPIRSIIVEQYATQKKKPIIRTGELGDTAGLIGAVHFALDHEFDNKKDKGRV